VSKSETIDSPYEVAQREATKLGMVLTRIEKKPGGGEHWMFDFNGKRVMNYWPKTLKAHFPNVAGGAFVVTGDEAAIIAAQTGKIPPQPTQQEYLNMKSRRGQELNYKPEQKRWKRSRRRHKQKAR
jgi:hypothetical protein